MQTILRPLSLKLLVAALMGACWFVGSANAQFSRQFQFSLPHEVRWGEAMLPAGEYRLKVGYRNAATFVTIQAAESGKTVAMVRCSITENDKNPKDGSALLIASRGGQRIVHSLKLAELGEVFVYDAALARGRGTSENARGTEPVRVLAAK